MAQSSRWDILRGLMHRTSVPPAVPLVGLGVPRLPFVWPPIGSVDIFAAGIATVVIWAFGMFPRRLRSKKSARRWAGFSLALALVSFLFYAHFLAEYVVRVETPRNGSQFRTVGSEKSTKALHDFPGESDGRLLEIAGLNDSDIEEMWTPSSVRRARFELFSSYLITLCMINLSLGAQMRLSGENARRPPAES